MSYHKKVIDLRRPKKEKKNFAFGGTHEEIVLIDEKRKY